MGNSGLQEWVSGRIIRFKNGLKVFTCLQQFCSCSAVSKREPVLTDFTAEGKMFTAWYMKPFLFSGGKVYLYNNCIMGDVFYNLYFYIFLRLKVWRVAGFWHVYQHTTHYMIISDSKKLKWQQQHLIAVKIQRESFSPCC